MTSLSFHQLLTVKQICFHACRKWNDRCYCVYSCVWHNILLIFAFLNILKTYSLKQLRAEVPAVWICRFGGKINLSFQTFFIWNISQISTCQFRDSLNLFGFADFHEDQSDKSKNLLNKHLTVAHHESRVFFLHNNSHLRACTLSSTGRHQ